MHAHCLQECPAWPSSTNGSKASLEPKNLCGLLHPAAHLKTQTPIVKTTEIKVLTVNDCDNGIPSSIHGSGRIFPRRSENRNITTNRSCCGLGTVAD